MEQGNETRQVAANAEKNDFPASISKTYKKSNFLISAKYSASLLENKLMAISLADSRENLEEDKETHILYNRIKASRLKEILHANDGSFYTQLDQVAKSMTGRVIGWTDPQRKTFEYISIISHAKYENGVLSIGYNPLLRDILNQSVEMKNFTTLQLPTMISLKNNNAFRLYEILSSHLYMGSRMYFDINELKLDLGIIDANEKEVQRVLGSSKNPNYQEAARVATHKKFESWYDFKRKVLDKAVEEINGNRDAGFDVSYEAEKSGRGGKVIGITFIVTMRGKAMETEPKTLTAEEMDDFLDLMREEIHVLLKTRDLKCIADAAKWNIEKIRMANQSMEAYGGKVENPVGFLIKALQEEYQVLNKTTGVSDKKAASGRSSGQGFHDFRQNDYDWERVEKKIISNQ